MKPPTRSATEVTLGQQLAEGLSAQDPTRLRALFATPLTFRAVTPRRFWDADSAVEAVDDVLLGAWFHSGRVVTEITSLTCGMVGDVHHVSYRMSVMTEVGPTVVEQTAYYSVSGGQISDIRLVCSGFQQV